ncbi:MAG: NAD(P)H-hydrate dehydratase [Candidatus Krumholzibacteriota bacterium]|nr:NAD(P)H-hydrate dehydratase [Candidatus Krumholzibacteriota bacterium]
MYVVTSEQMRMLDEETISRFTPGLTLMERAGQGIFESITSRLEGAPKKCVSIFLGRGNNAGDGLVVARLLADSGMKIILLYLHEPESLSPDAFKNHTRLKKFRSRGMIEEIYLYLAEGRQKAVQALIDSDLLVDALLGTGLNSPVRGNYAAVIEMINGSGLPVVAVDIPSGIHGTSGRRLGTAVKAGLTVTLGLPKTGSVFYPGKGFTGSLEVVDIGIPPEVIAEKDIKTHILDRDTALADLPRRDPTSHKFQCGSLLVVAGSRRYSGAAYLTALSALRTGCGIVYLAAPESIRTVIQSSAPEVIFIPLPETGSGSIDLRAIDLLFSSRRINAAALGPGVTTEDETVALVKEFVSRCQVPVLLDADGINAYRNDFASLKKCAEDKDIVISPHGGELKTLAGIEPEEDPLPRLEQLSSLVRGSRVTLVQKGAPTVIAHPDGRIDINVFGHPGMATAGSGDVLSGALAGFLAQGASPAAAARTGVYLHSRAAEIAAAEVGERAMIAGDCLEALPLAMRELEEYGDTGRMFRPFPG